MRLQYKGNPLSDKRIFLQQKENSVVYMVFRSLPLAAEEIKDEEMRA